MNAVEQLKRNQSVNFYEPLSPNLIEDILSESKIKLPSSHLELLKVTDGLECYGGYFRLFGLDKKKAVNLFSWNSDSLWRFSWGDKLDGFLCFGETAWGDQYAYRLNKDGEINSPEIYFLDGIAMNWEVIAEDFQTFFENEILLNASSPYDTEIVQVRSRLGDLRVEDHIVYMPSQLLSSHAGVEQVEKMDAVSSMVLNGDLWSQLGSESQERPVKNLDSYLDKDGRSRVKVIWA